MVGLDLFFGLKIYSFALELPIGFPLSTAKVLLIVKAKGTLPVCVLFPFAPFFEIFGQTLCPTVAPTLTIQQTQIPLSLFHPFPRHPPFVFSTQSRFFN